MIRFSLESKPWLPQQKMWRRRERGRIKEKKPIDENKKERNVSTPKVLYPVFVDTVSPNPETARQWASDAMKSTETQNTHNANNLEITHVQYANTVQHTWRTVHTRALGRGQDRKIKQGKVGQSPLQKHHFQQREHVGLSLLLTFARLTTHAHFIQDWNWKSQLLYKGG